MPKYCEYAKIALFILLLHHYFYFGPLITWLSFVLPPIAESP